jgi:hypothetical protein
VTPKVDLARADSDLRRDVQDESFALRRNRRADFDER